MHRRILTQLPGISMNPFRSSTLWIIYWSLSDTSVNWIKNKLFDLIQFFFSLWNFYLILKKNFKILKFHVSQKKKITKVQKGSSILFYSCSNRNRPQTNEKSIKFSNNGISNTIPSSRPISNFIYSWQISIYRSRVHYRIMTDQLWKKIAREFIRKT